LAFPLVAYFSTSYWNGGVNINWFNKKTILS
jgi:hypothetical protein